MKNKKLTRTCIGCRNKKGKKEMIRVVCNKAGEVRIDSKQQLEGRGAYICKDRTCIEKAQKGNKLKIMLRTNATNKQIEEIFSKLLQ